MKTYFDIYFIAINLITFIIYGIDKYKAKKDYHRIPERLLLLFAIVGGAFGGFIAMKSFRHKTRKNPFKWILPLLAMLWVAILFYLGSL